MRAKASYMDSSFFLIIGIELIWLFHLQSFRNITPRCLCSMDSLSCVPQNSNCCVSGDCLLVIVINLLLSGLKSTFHFFAQLLIFLISSFKITVRLCALLRDRYILVSSANNLIVDTMSLTISLINITLGPERTPEEHQRGFLDNLKSRL